MIHFREYLLGIVVMAARYLISGGLPWGSKQWITGLASDNNVGHEFTLPVACTVYAYAVTHQGSSPGATGILGNKAYDVGWTDTPVWIIAIGHD